MKRYLFWSGGKDSSASIVECYENGIHLDGVVFCEVMFDHKRNISGENPMHIRWVYETAIPIVESLGYKVIVLRDESDYIQEFYHVLKKSKDETRVGKYRGFFIGGMCVGNDRLKMRPIRNFKKSIGEPFEEIVGIAVDEPKRLARLQENKRSILAELDIAEEETYGICRPYNLLSPIYDMGGETRNGCWFCPNQSIKAFARLQKNYPELWDELKQLSQCDNLVSQNFKWGLTFEEVENKIDELNSQITLFD